MTSRITWRSDCFHLRSILARTPAHSLKYSGPSILDVRQVYRCLAQDARNPLHALVAVWAQVRYELPCWNGPKAMPQVHQEADKVFCPPSCSSSVIPRINTVLERISEMREEKGHFSCALHPAAAVFDCNELCLE
jgi:hypothetical protein